MAAEQFKVYAEFETGIVDAAGQPVLAEAIYTPEDNIFALTQAGNVVLQKSKPVKYTKLVTLMGISKVDTEDDPIYVGDILKRGKWEGVVSYIDHSYLLIKRGELSETEDDNWDITPDWAHYTIIGNTYLKEKS
jgi:hypothetical protein